MNQEREKPELKLDSAMGLGVVGGARGKGGCESGLVRWWAVGGEWGGRLDGDNSRFTRTPHTPNPPTNYRTKWMLVLLTKRLQCMSSWSFIHNAAQANLEPFLSHHHEFESEKAACHNTRNRDFARSGNFPTGIVRRGPRSHGEACGRSNWRPRGQSTSRLLRIKVTVSELLILKIY